LDKALLKRLVDLVQGISVVANSKSLMAVEDNGFTGVLRDDVPQRHELQRLEKLGYIQLTYASGMLYDIVILDKALRLFN